MLLGNIADFYISRLGEEVTDSSARVAPLLQSEDHSLGDDLAIMTVWFGSWSCSVDDFSGDSLHIVA